MASQSAAVRREDADETLLGAAEILGGRRVWKHPPSSKFEVHESILEGIPGRALTHFLHHRHFPIKVVAGILGISSRTVQRVTESAGSLKADPGARLWKLAEILSAAAKLQGGLKEGKEWLEMPAPALNQKTPLEMMTTQAGAEMVERLLVRLKYGVYT